MFWRKAFGGDPPLPPERATDIERAAVTLGVREVRWKRDGAEFAYRDKKRLIPALTLTSIVPESGVPARDVLTMLALAELLDLTPPAELLADFAAVRALMRPRLVHPRELTGPRRTMCRRETFGGLIHAAAIGPSHAAPLVTSAMLDRWPVKFEDVLMIASENLHASIAERDLHEVAGAQGVLAFVSDHEQAASASFLLDRFAGEAPTIATRGMLFSVPHEALLLLMPVVPASGADALAAMVQTTFQTADAADEPLSESLFWFRGPGDIADLPMTIVTDGKSRRVHLEAKGTLEELLRVLGAIGEDE
jgi:hypothetical protein